MRFRARSLQFALLLPCLLLGGCTVLGVVAYKLKPPETVQPKYTNLIDQSVGVMVWADRGIRIDWPTLQLDLANSIDHKLQEQSVDAKGKPKAKTLLGVKYPYPPASIIRYQQDHPDVEALPVTDVAPKLHVSRLIYVELEDFATRSGQAVELFRGRGKATVRIIEIDPEGQTAHVAYTWENIQATYPPKAPSEGVPNAGDQRIYVGTVDALGTEIAQLFFPYWVEE
jgi:hypothetical protein